METQHRKTVESRHGGKGHVLAQQRMGQCARARIVGVEGEHQHLHPLAAEHLPPPPRHRRGFEFGGIDAARDAIPEPRLGEQRALGLPRRVGPADDEHPHLPHAHPGEDDPREGAQQHRSDREQGPGQAQQEPRIVPLHRILQEAGAQECQHGHGQNVPQFSPERHAPPVMPTPRQRNQHACEGYANGQQDSLLLGGIRSEIGQPEAGQHRRHGGREHESGKIAHDQRQRADYASRPSDQPCRAMQWHCPSSSTTLK